MTADKQRRRNHRRALKREAVRLLAMRPVLPQPQGHRRAEFSCLCNLAMNQWCDGHTRPKAVEC